MPRTAKIIPCVGIGLILAIGIIHVIGAPDSFHDAVYKGWLFYANGLASLVAAAGIFCKKNWGWNLGVLIAAGAFLGYVSSRTVGMPFIPAEPDAWLEPLGVMSLVAEASFVTLFFARATSKTRG